MDYRTSSGPARFTQAQYAGPMFPSGSTMGPVPNTRQATGGTQRVASANAALPLAQRQPTPEPPRPTMEQMMESDTREFQGWIQDMDDFRSVKEEYLRIHDKEVPACLGFPSEKDKQKELVKEMFVAAQDCSETYEPKNSQSLKRITEGKWKDLEFELVLWPLLFSARDAQEGKCRIPNYLSCQYNSYGTFTERFEAVCEALKSSKDIVASLFKDATFKHRLAWRPRAELNQKATNRKLNGERDIQNSIGIQATERHGIRKNQNGELVGDDGQKYGTVKKQTLAFENKISKTTKRPRSTKRSDFATRLATQEDINAAALPVGRPNLKKRPAPLVPRPASQAQPHPEAPLESARSTIDSPFGEFLFGMEGLFDADERAPLTGSSGSFGSVFGDGSSMPPTPLNATFDPAPPMNFGDMGFNMGFNMPQPQGNFGQLGQFQGVPRPFDFGGAGPSLNQTSQFAPAGQMNSFGPAPQTNLPAPNQAPVEGQSQYPDLEELLNNGNWNFGGNNA